jgi:hypothetical protein
MPPKYSFLQDITIQALILFVGIVIVTAVIVIPVFIYKKISGFQDVPQPDMQMPQPQPDMQMQPPDMQMPQPQQPDMQMQPQQPDMQMQPRQPDTQLPPVQMPASVMNNGYTRPSLDECKKHYTCGISTTMN